MVLLTAPNTEPSRQIEVDREREGDRDRERERERNSVRLQFHDQTSFSKDVETERGEFDTPFPTERTIKP
jgi:hypothetical protein